MLIQRNFNQILLSRLQESTPLIQLIIGPRQVGKTTGVKQVIESYSGDSLYVTATGESNELWLKEQWRKARQLKNSPVLIIDEVQKVQNWAETVKELWDRQESLRLVLLGSSSLSLFKGATESLAGRFERIHVSHWGYLETKKLKEISLNEYLQYGGYPGSYRFLDDLKRWQEYVKLNIVDLAISQDILSFETVKEPALFRHCFEILCSYPSQIVSLRKILGSFQEGGHTSKVKHYLALYQGAELISTIPKFGQKEHLIKSSIPKIIPMSCCLYYLYTSSKEKMSFVFEARIGQILLSLGGRLFYWREGDFEVDYILQWEGDLYAIEVKSGRRKNSRSLSEFSKKYPKAKSFVLTPENYEEFETDPALFLNSVL